MTTAQLIARLELETGGSARTIRRWIVGQPVSPLAAYALASASRKLKLRLPSKKKGARRARR